MTIAGGIMGALFQRERTGEATVVDVSLLGTGLWAMGQAIALSLMLDMPWHRRPARATATNPLVGDLRTKDGRFLAFTMLQAAQVLAAAVRHRRSARARRTTRGSPTRPRAREQRRSDADPRRGVRIERTLEEWRERLDAFEGQWAVVQNTLEAAEDPQIRRERLPAAVRDRGRHPVRARRRAGPVRRGARGPRAGPEFNEHGDEILAGLGLDWDTIVDLKVRGVVA